MNNDEKIIIEINKTSKIIASMNTDNMIITKLTIKDVKNFTKETVQKIIKDKLDLEEFMNKLDELEANNEGLKKLVKIPSRLQIIENNGNLIKATRKSFQDLLDKVKFLLDQVKLNKELSEFLD